MSNDGTTLDIEPSAVRVSDDVLCDLRARIHNARLPEPAPGAAWEQGTDREYLRALLDYWADGFDWRAQERYLNGFEQFHAVLDGVRIHFVHVKARYGAGIPLILTHGWPSTYAEFLPLVPMLTDPTAHESMDRHSTSSSRLCPDMPSPNVPRDPSRTALSPDSGDG